MLTRHVAVLFVPIMIVTLTTVLQGGRVLGLTAWLYPAGLLGAVVWTRLWFTSTIAMIVVRGEAVGILTFAELSSRRQPTWSRVTGLSKTEDQLEATIGLSPYRFVRGDWPEIEELAASLERARLSAQR